MASVRYLYGSEQGYQNLREKDPYTFYKTPTNLYLGTMKLTNEVDIGDLSQLKTNDKSSVIAAINEIVESGVPSTDTWQTF